MAVSATPESWLDVWHFVRPDRRLLLPFAQYSKVPVAEAGATFHIEGPADELQDELRGIHRAIDALALGGGPVACLIKCLPAGEDGGKISVACTVMWAVDVSRALHEFAIWCAQGALQGERDDGREHDRRFWAAIDAKAAWLRGGISDDDLNAAREQALRAYLHGVGDDNWHVYKWAVGPARAAAVHAARRDPLEAARLAAENAILAGAEGAAFSAYKAARSRGDEALSSFSWKAIRDSALAEGREAVNRELTSRLVDPGRQ